MGFLSRVWGWYLRYWRWYWGLRWRWRGAIFVAVLFILLAAVPTETEENGGTADTDQSTTATTAAQAATATRTSTPKPTPAWSTGVSITRSGILAALDDAEETARSEGLDRPASVNFNEAAGTIGLEYTAEDALSETDLLTIGAHTAFSAMRALFSNPNVQSVRVTLLADWTDQLGNTKSENTTMSLLTRATVSQINWSGLEDRVYGDNKLFFCISDEKYIHPAIFSRLGDVGCLLR